MRNLFEWGEYQQLIDTLEPALAASSCTIDSAHRGRYHCYLAVAYYAKGRVGDARKQFLSALSYAPDVDPDPRYVSEEIVDFFTAVRTDAAEKIARARAEDSLLASKQRAFEANLRAVKNEELRKSRRVGSIAAMACFTLGAAFAAGAAYEYYSTRDPYADFRDAAQAGDKPAYDRLLPSIKRAKGVIVGCSVAAGLSCGAGISVTLRSLRMK